MAANFANVALTDSFDTWRVRTNQIITDINTSTASAIANTVVRRDDTGDGGFSMGALNVSGKINSTLGTGTALELTSTKDIDINFQADSGALVVAGGASIAKDLNIGVDLHVGGNIEAKGNIKLGTSPSSALGGLDDDILELNADISTDIEPEGSVANTERNIGADGKRWKQGYFWRSVGVNESSHLLIPSGTSADSPTIDTNSSGTNRDLHLRGAIRYNSTLSRFEGYNHTANTFVGLGGAIDADQDTKISLELASGSDEDTITFTTEGVNRWSMGNTSAGGHFVPDQNDIYDIGLDATRVRSVYANNMFATSVIGRDATSSLSLPAGTTGQRPTTILQPGMVRFNTELDGGRGAIEYYSSASNQWYQMSTSAATYKSRITGQSAGTTSVNATHNEAYVSVFLNGIKLDDTDFTKNGTTIGFNNFTIGPTDIVDVLSIAAADLAKAAFEQERFVATAGQTQFTTNKGYTVGMLDVFKNGTKVDSNDVTASDGSTFTIGACSVNDIIEIKAYTQFYTTDLYTKSQWANTGGTNSIQANTYVGVDPYSHANSVLAVDVTNNRVGVGIKSPGNALHVHNENAAQVKISHTFAANATIGVDASGDVTVAHSGATTTIDSNNVVITGNLQVQGDQTILETSKIQQEDPLILLNNFSTDPATNTSDTGFIFKRGTGETQAGGGTGVAHSMMIWDESADEFVFGETTDDGDTAGNVTIVDYEKVHVGALEAEDPSVFNSTLSISGTTTFNGQIGSDFIPDTDGDNAGNGRMIGSSTKRFERAWIRTVTTGDIHMENENGEFTLDEQPEYIRVYNHKNGKYYKLMMEELDE